MIESLNHLFRPQVSLAENQNQNLIAQALASSNGDNLLKSLGRYRSPEMDFSVNANSVGEGIIQGLGNAFNNSRQLRDHQQVFDLMAQRDLAAAQEEQRKLDLGNQALGTLMNPGASPEEKLGAYQGLNIATGGKFAETIGTGYGNQQVDLDGIPLEAKANARATLENAPTTGKAEAIKSFTQNQAIADLIRQDILNTYGFDLYGKFEDSEGKGQQIPAGARNRLNQLGYENPEDYLSDVERLAKASSAQSGATIASVNAQALPTEKQQQIISKGLDISIKKVEAKYAEAMAVIDKLTGENRVEEAQTLKTNLNEARPLYEQMLQRYDSLTPGEIKLFNSNMKSLEMPFELPEKELKAVTEKGRVKQFYDPDTGETLSPKEKGASPPAPPAKATPPQPLPTPPKKPAAKSKPKGFTPGEDLRPREVREKEYKQRIESTQQKAALQKMNKEAVQKFSAGAIQVSLDKNHMERVAGSYRAGNPGKKFSVKTAKIGGKTYYKVVKE